MLENWSTLYQIKARQLVAIQQHQKKKAKKKKKRKGHVNTEESNGLPFLRILCDSLTFERTLGRF